MNFPAILGVIESLTKTYTCPDCWKNVWEQWFDLVWAAWSTLNINVLCDNCKKLSIIRTDVKQIWVDISNVKDMKEKIKEIKEWLDNANKKISEIKLSGDNKIKEEDILDLNKKIKKRLDVSELFSDK